MNVLVLGTVALDTVKTPSGKRENILGGSAAHFSMSARLFTKVSLMANVGEDFPKRHIDFLKKQGLDLTSLNVEKGNTFRWEGEYQGNLNSALTLNTHLGVLANFCPSLSQEQKKIPHVFLANVDPDIQAKLLDCMQAPRLVGLDSMNYWINNKRKSLLKILKRVDIYVANDQEAKSLSSEDNLVKAAQYLRSLGPKMVLIKKGENGSLLYGDKFIFILPAYPMEKVVDPTGAGDTFAGGFMGYLASVKKLDGASLKKAVLYGTIAASFNIEAFGLERTAKLTLKDLEQRLKNFKRIIAL